MHKQAEQIGKKIWFNECGGTVEGLTSWNEGEEFASLGIAHFIWHPRIQKAPFTATFPALVQYLIKKKVSVPHWLRHAQYCPWSNREEFRKAHTSQRMQDLRATLSSSVAEQTSFIIERVQQSLSSIVRKLSPQARHHIIKQFNLVGASPNGAYVLVDYVNFKGDGSETFAQYGNQGWGLLQVLEGMKSSKPGLPTIQDFVQSAQRVLKRRVEHAPKERNEQRWLPGWFNRLATYTNPT